MADLISNLGNNPIIVVGVIAVLVLIVFSIAKKLIKVALFVVAVAALSMGYWAYTGQEPPERAQAIREKVRGSVKKGAHKAGEVIKDKVAKGAEKAGEAIKHKVAEGVEEGAEKAGDAVQREVEKAGDAIEHAAD